MPKVTVIVPNYNHGRYLRERLDSVLAQTYTDFEILYLDDASTDDSDTVLNTYLGNPHLALILKNQVNSGSPFVQWNRGIAHARGEYVWIAEADDRAAPTFLERLVAVLDTHPNVGVAYCQSRLIDAQGCLSGSAYDYNKNLGAFAERWRRDFIADGREEVAHVLARQNTLPNASAVVFRRAVYQAVGGADTWLRLAGDYLLWVRMLLVSDLAFVADPLNDFRRHSGTVRHQTYRDSTFLRENYRVQSLLREMVPIPAQIREAACDDLMDRWTELAVLQPGRATLDDLRAVWRCQRDADPAPVPRFLRRFALRVRDKVARLGGVSG